MQRDNCRQIERHRGRQTGRHSNRQTKIQLVNLGLGVVVVGVPHLVGGGALSLVSFVIHPASEKLNHLVLFAQFASLGKEKSKP